VYVNFLKLSNVLADNGISKIFITFGVSLVSSIQSISSRMLARFLFGWLIWFLWVNNLAAQDPQFSQYYAAPMYLNPGLVGINQQGSFGVNYRNQWPNLEANFETFSFYIDNYFEEQRSALGLIFTTDREGIAGLRSTTVGLQYAYQLQLTPQWVFRPGMEVAYMIRDVNFGELTFGDQFDQNGLVNPVSAENLNTGEKAQFVDLAFGGIFYSESAWLGAAVHHITEPNQSLTGDVAKLPRRISVHGGYKIPFARINKRIALRNNRLERSITPTFSYRGQGNFDQLDLGAFVTLEPLLLGAWYRGLPVRNVDGVKNVESIIMMIGLQQDRMSIGYSFDYTLSDLGIGTGGAHELSFTYAFSLNPNKPPLSVRKLNCPVPFIF
jgi:type IX secretion system PorP/SprF family membrane protein